MRCFWSLTHFRHKKEPLLHAENNERYFINGESAQDIKIQLSWDVSDLLYSYYCLVTGDL